MKRNEYAIVILAGGQGTRLGFNGPKGTYKIFPKENITFVLCQTTDGNKDIYVGNKDMRYEESFCK